MQYKSNEDFLILAANILEKANRSNSASTIRSFVADRRRRKESLGELYSLPLTPFMPSSIGADGVAYQREIIRRAESISLSNGSSISNIAPYRVGIITDIYMLNFYKDVFLELHYLTPDNYEDVFKAVKFDAIIYVSCWKGVSNEEWRGVKFREKPSSALEGIIAAAKHQQARLIFQSIEDPSNFDYFLPIAKKFDFIFTSDADSIDAYKLECGHENVFYGEYGVNPNLHNPIGCRSDISNTAFFAGSWAGRYPERCEDMVTIFDSILEKDHSLIIVDRNYGTEAEDLKYPSKYEKLLVPSLEHDTLQNAHKLFRYNLNFNSIKNSPTMCAMRIYELQAMGVGILSNYAKSVFNKFPDIRLIPHPADLSHDFVGGQELEEYRQNMIRVRRVLTSHTAFEVVSHMSERIGLGSLKKTLPKVAIIYDNEVSISSIALQQYPNCIAVESSSIDSSAGWKRFVADTGVAYFTWFDSSCAYERYYIQDLINALTYTKCEFVTKHAWFDRGNLLDGAQHEYTRHGGGKARTLFSVERFSPGQFDGFNLHESLFDIGDGYAIDPFELNYEMSRSSAVNADRLEYVLSVIVPVYNNGDFLREKCIASIKRNTCWKNVEVILVDDGSSDASTLDVIRDIASQYKNVKVFRFTDGGSGSASRPRNKGIELSTGRLVSFLDPDNEISPGGYDTLIRLYDEQATKGELDFVCGYHVKVEESSKIIGRHTTKRISLIKNLRAAFFERGKFPVIPTQPAVISREMLMASGIRFVEGAAGQDTLFGWELISKAKSGAFTSSVYLIYYAQRAGSIVNHIDEGYFKKKLVLETHQSEFLKKDNLMDLYKQGHYDRFMNDWYLPKLRQVSDPAERAKCVQILHSIADMYGVSPSV